MEEVICIQSGNIRLEAKIEKGSNPAGVVITHPHPLYGGDMDNPVVLAIKNAYREKGLTTLRFNFRGVGTSEGTYDDGKGEADDVRSALSLLAETGIDTLCLAGYSFGSWVNARVNSEGFKIDHMMMISPPVAFMDFSSIEKLDCRLMVITGTLDDLAPPRQVDLFSRKANKHAVVQFIDGSDHFYFGFIETLQAKILALLSYY